MIQIELIRQLNDQLKLQDAKKRAYQEISTASGERLMHLKAESLKAQGKWDYYNNCPLVPDKLLIEMLKEDQMKETKQTPGRLNRQLGVIGGNMRETTFKILTQGDVQMAHGHGYMVAGGEDAVCFYIDPCDRAYISASTESDSGCPVVYVSRDDCEQDTEIEFSEFKGWRFHAGGAGKTIAVALVRRAADDA